MLSPWAKQSANGEEEFSLNPSIIRDILQFAKPFGHHEDSKNLNLGFGFLYYGLVRTLRPKHILVIGSGYGFSVVCLALGLRDNNHGILSFVDPSYSLLKDGPFKTIGGRSHWDSEEKVREHFALFGVADIVTHFKMCSDEFFCNYEREQLPPLDLAFIDGSHAFKDVRYDFIATVRRSRKNSFLFLHDTNIYVREILHHSGVKRWLNFLKKFPDLFEIINFPFSSGVALLRVKESQAWKRLQQ